MTHSITLHHLGLIDHYTAAGSLPAVLCDAHSPELAQDLVYYVANTLQPYFRTHALCFLQAWKSNVDSADLLVPY